MTWISFVCLLALSSVAFGYSLGGYSQLTVPEAPVRPTLPLSDADIVCKGKPADTVILVNDGGKFIVCTTDGKGDEISCPSGLVYSVETKRCEYKVSVNENVCASQPCLNGGRCIPTLYSYECDCSQGFSGRTCELDASVCQQQQPCGSSIDAVCQSFNVGSALKHVCVFENGRAYGSTRSEAFRNPCLTGGKTHPLAFGKEGYIMCAAKQMSIQSCPGGTVWDPVNEACSWPDMEETVSSVISVEAPARRLIEVPSKSEFVPTSSGSQSFRMASSESGGFSASLSSDDDFTSRFDAAEFRPVQVAAQEAIPSSVSRSRSSSGDDFTSRLAGGEFQAAAAPGQRASADRSVDFTSRLAGGEFMTASAPGRRLSTARMSAGSSADFTRRFDGGDFERTSETRGGIRGMTGFPFAGTPGASRNGRTRDDFNGPFIRGMSTDDSTSSSIRIPFRPSSTGNSEMERRGMLPSSFFGRPGEARRSS